MTTHTYDDTVVIPALKQTLLWEHSELAEPTEKPGAFLRAEQIDLDAYDVILLMISGGKDSLACLLHLFDLGVDRSKIELWHHRVDGHPDEGSNLMDWPCVDAYNQAVADTYQLPIYYSWLEGGFEGEMLKDKAISRPHKVETPSGLITLERDPNRSKIATRRKFPQVSPSLTTRWCSSALKIDPGRRALNNQERFNGKKVLFITGERRQESASRSKYFQLEPHACDRRKGRTARLVDAWRPVLEWDEERVWDALRRHRVIAPVPYRLGWGRSSCQTCIYNGPRIWATLRTYFPEKLEPIARYEREFGVTISRSRRDVITIAQEARPFEINDLEALEQAMRTAYTLPILAETDAEWKLPAGAFAREGCGSD